MFDNELISNRALTEQGSAFHPPYKERIGDFWSGDQVQTGAIVQEDGSYYSLGNAEAIAPEMDLSDAAVDDHDPYTDKAYTYRHLFSDDFSDRHGYKWTVKSGTFDAADETKSPAHESGG